MKAYDEIYLEDTSENLGAMMEYAGVFPLFTEHFWNNFVSSNLAKQIEEGNPRVIAGMSGKDYFEILMPYQNDLTKESLKKEVLEFNDYYWAAWALAHLQYETGLSFFEINQYLPWKKVLSLYCPLHEADISKFIEVAKRNLPEKKDSNLKRIRLANCFSQHGLALSSGVDLRSIQMYEQKRNDINKAQVGTLLKLSKALHCSIESLLERPF